MKQNTKKHILNITFVGLFAALSYISLMLFFFPFAQMYIHFGNMIVVVASLLVGGIQGGLAGSIGMGMFDLFNGHADSAPKTFILKFLIGITVGFIYRFLKKRKKYPSLALFISGIVSLLISLALYLYSYLGQNKFSGKISVLAPILIIVGILCITFAALKTKLSQKTASAVVGASVGMLVNLLGEISWKTVQFWIAGSSFKAAFSASLLTQGSTLINAGISVIGGVALYIALNKPFSKLLNQ